MGVPASYPTFSTLYYSLADSDCPVLRPTDSLLACGSLEAVLHLSCSLLWVLFCLILLFYFCVFLLKLYFFSPLKSDTKPFLFYQFLSSISNLLLMPNSFNMSVVSQSVLLVVSGTHWGSWGADKGEWGALALML